MQLVAVQEASVEQEDGVRRSHLRKRDDGRVGTMVERGATEAPLAARRERIEHEPPERLVIA